MARLPYATREDTPQAHQAAYDRMINERGGGNIFLALANIPNLTNALLDFTKEMKVGAVVEQRLRELSILTVGHVSECPYEFDHHWNNALKAGLRRAQMEQLSNADSSPEYDEQERAIVRYAREVTLTGDASEQTWANLRRYLPPREAMDIVMSVAWYNAVIRILKPLRIEIEPTFVKA
jgi:alkylhydroperoxidase family enzyme